MRVEAQGEAYELDRGNTIIMVQPNDMASGILAFERGWNLFIPMDTDPFYELADRLIDEEHITVMNLMANPDWNREPYHTVATCLGALLVHETEQALA